MAVPRNWWGCCSNLRHSESTEPQLLRRLEGRQFPVCAESGPVSSTWSFQDKRSSFASSSVPDRVCRGDDQAIQSVAAAEKGMTRAKRPARRPPAAGGHDCSRAGHRDANIETLAPCLRLVLWRVREIHLSDLRARSTHKIVSSRAADSPGVAKEHACAYP
jgi:hypothetical protein